MVFCPDSRQSCEYYGIDYDTKKHLSDEEKERQRYEDENKVEKRSLMAKPASSYDYHPSQSRDYALSHTIPCNCIVCPANKNSYCEVPSLIKMNAKAQCTTGLAFVEQEKKPRDEETKPMKMNGWTPLWFYNRWDTNCPQYTNKEELNDMLLELVEVTPGHADWSNDIRRVHEERGIK